MSLVNNVDCYRVVIVIVIVIVIVVVIVIVIVIVRVRVIVRVIPRFFCRKSANVLAASNLSEFVIPLSRLRGLPVALLSGSIY